MKSLSLEIFKAGAGDGRAHRGRLEQSPSRGPFCCAVMTGRPLHYHVTEVRACPTFNSSFSGVR